MSLLLKLGMIVEECRQEYGRLLAENSPQFFCDEQIGDSCESGLEKILACGDNLDFMRHLLRERELSEKIKLIYIDPPFFSGADYSAEIRINSDKFKLPRMKQRAYHDTWENGMEEYLRMLTVRLFFMRELLAPEGNIWVHLDWHVVHYVKVIMDEIFGEKNFINEVIWTYKSGGVSKRHFARKHDTLLFYVKDSKKYFFEAQQEKSYNRGYKPYRFKGVKEYKDELGWYTMVNRKDVWQIDMVGRTSSERMGYATQKPELLLEQILQSCTREGDLCADFFSGSGTLAAVAERLSRRWICCDSGLLAVAETKRRLAQKDSAFSCYVSRNLSKNRTAAGKVFANVTLHENELSDTMILTVELTGYQIPGMSGLPVGEKQLAEVKKIIRKDPLALVDFWTVDTSYDGEIYRPKAFLYREKGKLTVSYEILIRKASAACVKVHDVFGGCGFLCFDDRGKEFGAG